MPARNETLPPEVCRLLDTSIGKVVVHAGLENEYLLAVAFDENGIAKAETTAESVLDVEAGWTAALMELGLPEDEARAHVRDLAAAAESAFAAWETAREKTRRRWPFGRAPRT